MQSNLSAYWRRAFQHRDPLTIRVQRETATGPQQWADPKVVQLFKPTEPLPEGAEAFVAIEDERRAQREWDAYKLREKRITRGLFVGALVLVTIILCACGGGEATADEIAQHDADLQAMQAAEAHRVKIPAPVNCAASSACR